MSLRCRIDDILPAPGGRLISALLVRSYLFSFRLAMLSPHRPLVCVIDDERAVRDLARQILESHGYSVHVYGSAEEFLGTDDEATASCLVMDLCMPKLNGLELQQRLKELGSAVPVVVLSAYADVRTAVRLMEGGAVTVMEKPYLPEELTAAVDRAVQLGQARRQRNETLQIAQRNLEELSGDELDVLNAMVAGLPNKAIALRLGLSMRTVDRRRQQVLAKMGVQSPAALATLVAQLDTHR